MYLLPILYHLTRKPPFYCKCSLGTINGHSELDINTLHQKLERISEEMPVMSVFKLSKLNHFPFNPVDLIIWENIKNQHLQINHYPKILSSEKMATRDEHIKRTKSEILSTPRKMCMETIRNDSLLPDYYWMSGLAFYVVFF